MCVDNQVSIPSLFHCSRCVCALSELPLPRLHYRGDGEAVASDADYRRHAAVELAIRDLKEGSGLEHGPSGEFNANVAGAVLTSIAHNLVRWVAALGLELKGLLVAHAIRRKLIALPGRITQSARRCPFHLPTHWSWATHWATYWSTCVAHLVKPQTHIMVRPGTSSRHSRVASATQSDVAPLATPN